MPRTTWTIAIDAIDFLEFSDEHILVGGLEHVLFISYIGNNNPIWLVFFRAVETTNQYIWIKFPCFPVEDCLSASPLDPSPLVARFWHRRCSLFSQLYWQLKMQMLGYWCLASGKRLHSELENHHFESVNQRTKWAKFPSIFQFAM